MKASCTEKEVSSTNSMIKTSFAGFLKKHLLLSELLFIDEIYISFHWIQCVQAELHPFIISKKEKEMSLQYFLVGKVNLSLAWAVHSSTLNRASCVSYKGRVAFCLQNCLLRDMMVIQMCSWIVSYCKDQTVRVSMVTSR